MKPLILIVLMAGSMFGQPCKATLPNGDCQVTEVVAWKPIFVEVAKSTDMKTWALTQKPDPATISCSVFLDLSATTEATVPNPWSMLQAVYGIKRSAITISTDGKSFTLPYALWPGSVVTCIWNGVISSK